jgi:hypothetical protein
MTGDNSVKIEIGDNLKSTIAGSKPYILMIIGIALCLYLLSKGFNINDLSTIVPEIMMAGTVVGLAYSEKAGKQN